MMSRHLILLACASLLIQPKAFADGLPYHTDDSGKRAMIGDYVALSLSKEQVEEVSRSGVVTFDEQQLRKLHAFYPTFPAKAGVAASTYNDNLEREQSTVDVIWWHADEILVTLESPRRGSEMTMPSSNAWARDTDLLVRIAPDGLLYRNGKSVGIRDVIDVIDQVAAKPKAEPGYEHQFRVVVPPPHRQWAEINSEIVKQVLPENTDTDPKIVIPRIFEFLETYARAKGLGLHKSW